VQIRDAAAADADAIARLHAASWQRTYRGMFRDDFLDGPVVDDRLAEWRARMGAPAHNQLVLVAEDAGGLLGFICLFGAEDPRLGTLIDNLHVRHDTRRRGVGRALMREAARWAERRYPGTALYLLVLRANVNAQRFYDRLGGANAGLDERPGADGATAYGYVYVWTSPQTLLAVASHDGGLTE
jgi:ribosomal protein S18 acetylase RimI-like enzyme